MAFSCKGQKRLGNRSWCKETSATMICNSRLRNQEQEKPLLGQLGKLGYEPNNIIKLLFYKQLFDHGYAECLIIMR